VLAVVDTIDVALRGYCILRSIQRALPTDTHSQRTLTPNGHSLPTDTHSQRTLTPNGHSLPTDTHSQRALTPNGHSLPTDTHSQRALTPNEHLLPTNTFTTSTFTTNTFTTSTFTTSTFTTSTHLQEPIDHDARIFDVGLVNIVLAQVGIVGRAGAQQRRSECVAEGLLVLGWLGVSFGDRMSRSKGGKAAGGGARGADQIQSDLVCLLHQLLVDPEQRYLKLSHRLVVQKLDAYKTQMRHVRRERR
jgi:hypothetical protein